MPQTYLHVTSAGNRASITQHGLDWRQMGLEPGVAGNRGTPELEGIWLVEDWDEVEYFASPAIGSGIEAVDVWEVTLDEGESLVEDDAGYWYFAGAIGPATFGS